MKRTAFIAFVLVTTVYLILGSLVFHFIETAHEKKEKKAFEMDHQNFLDAHEGVSREELYDYVAKVVDATQRGVPVMAAIAKGTNVTINGTVTNATREGGHDYDTKWDVVSAFLFTLTTISTIGYGKLAPTSQGGQLFCIFFALIGVPLFATSLLGVGERMQIPLRYIKNSRPWYKGDPKKDGQLKTAVFLTLGMCILVFLPSIVLSKTEDWTFVESMYFCIITMTTIGFGDYVPGTTGGSVGYYAHRIMLAVWILIGLSWVALILSELGSIMKNQIIEAAAKTSSRIVDLEANVVKRAKDARDKIAQKASIHWRRRSRRRPGGDVYKTHKVNVEMLKVNSEMLAEWPAKQLQRLQSKKGLFRLHDMKNTPTVTSSNVDEIPEVGHRVARKHSPRISPKKHHGEGNGLPGVYRPVDPFDSHSSSYKDSSNFNFNKESTNVDSNQSSDSNNKDSNQNCNANNEEDSKNSSANSNNIINSNNGSNSNLNTEYPNNDSSLDSKSENPLSRVDIR